MAGRILQGEEKLLKAYLYPNLEDKEAKDLKAYRDKKRAQQKALLNAENLNGVEEEEDEVDEGLADELGARMAARGGMESDSVEEESEKSSKVTDDEKESDSDFMDRMDLNEDPEHMDQRQKGLRIEDIGGVQGLDIKKQVHLKDLDYKDSSEEEDNPKDKKANKFF